jgi:predicted AlkP superfamily pyrophosphatase or phosphodiesterase
MFTRRRRPLAPLLAIGLVGVVAFVYLRGGDTASRPGAAERLGETDRAFASNDPIERACSLDEGLLVRLWRGHQSGRSEDVTLVPFQPNYMGDFDLTSHSGPWDYLQQIPLVLYGPRRIEKAGAPVDRPVNLVDVYATAGTLSHVDLPRRDGGNLNDSLIPGVPGAPKLIVTVVWDGVGRNTLEVWPGRWPNLARMERAGTSYLNATVGSSPSITPASHGSLGTGAWPRAHGLTAIEYRGEDGEIRGAVAGRDPADLALTTFADEIDRALGNVPKVGLLGFNNWHIPMMGHGLGTPGGDADQLAIIGVQAKGEVTGNDELFETPDYLNSGPGLTEYAAELDRADGEVDGEWLGHDILDKDHNPAWVRFATDRMLTMLEREDYGRDEVTDFFFVNLKMTDIAGHEWSIDSPEMAEVLEAQDASLGRLIAFLEHRVRDYVVVVTSDHGHTRATEKTGAWPIRPGVLRDDIASHFGISDSEKLFPAEGAYGLYLDRDVMRTQDVTLDDVARFANRYTIEDNWGGGDLPEGYENRGDEPVFSAAYPSDRLPEIMRCKFDSPRPPADIDA